jgi:hypothetical protein
MNHFIEYVCRGVVHTEDALKRLNKNVMALAKCNRRLAGTIICYGVAGILLTCIVMDQDKEIKALKKQVSDLVVKEETHTTTEEQNDQEGA